jgi:hypothetical protein
MKQFLVGSLAFPARAILLAIAAERARRSRIAGRGLAVAAALVLAVVTLGSQAWAQQCLSAGNGPTCTNPAGTTISGDGITDNQNAFNVTNSGVISSSDVGIFENNAAGTLTVSNSGTISATGTDSTGISADFTANVTNSGIISASGPNSVGISAAIANVANSGTISATGVGSAGIGAGDGDANVSNSGKISASGADSAGIVAGNIQVTNTGIISASGKGSVGIFAVGANANVVNSGTISGETGIKVVDGAGTTGSTLVNSGSIIGTGGTAIDYSESVHDSLTFLPGSRIVGAILLGAGDTVNVRTGRGISSILTFTPNPNGASSISASGTQPIVVGGSSVAALDPTAFGLADRSLMNVTGGISALVQNRFGGMAPVGSGAGVSSFAPAADKATEAFNGIPSLAIAYAPETPAFKAPPFAGAGITTVWTGAFGGVRHQSADGAMLGATDSAIGAALGVDRQIAPDLKLGGFIGGGAGRLSVDLNSQSVDTGYIFGGAYGRYDWASQFADFMLYGGRTSSNSSRTVANNLAAGGLETATARYDGFFISPDLAYGWRLPVGSGYVLTPTARLRYVAGLFDGFSETGSAQNLSVGSRTIQDFEQRFELDLTRTMTVGASDTLKAGLHVGAIGLERVGDTTVNTVLLGQNLAFVTPGRADAFGGLAGTSFDFASHAHISVFGALEGIWMNDRSTTVTAKAGLRGAF